MAGDIGNVFLAVADPAWKCAVGGGMVRSGAGNNADAVGAKDCTIPAVVIGPTESVVRKGAGAVSCGTSPKRLAGGSALLRPPPRGSRIGMPAEVGFRPRVRSDARLVSGSSGSKATCGRVWRLGLDRGRPRGRVAGARVGSVSDGVYSLSLWSAPPTWVSHIVMVECWWAWASHM